MGFSRQEYCSGLPFPSLGDLPDPGTEPGLLHWQVDSLPLSPLGKPFGCVEKAEHRSDKGVCLAPLLSYQQKIKYTQIKAHGTGPGSWGAISLSAPFMSRVDVLQILGTQ